jgi:hypothetical protein
MSPQESEGKSLLKSSESFVDLIKNIVLIVIIGYCFFFGREALRQIFKDISQGKSYATEFSAGKEGIKIKLQRATTDLTLAANDLAKSEGKKDQVPSKESKDVVAALSATRSALANVQETSSASEFKEEWLPDPQPWVYIGILKDGRWNPNNFNLTSAPSEGMVIKAATDVFERQDLPVYVPEIGDWKLGKVSGVLPRGKEATIEDLKQIEADNGGVIWWAKIKR